MPGNYATPVHAAYARAMLYAYDPNDRGVLSGADDFPHTATDITFQVQERTMHEARGPGSRYLQGQEIMTKRYPIRTNFEVYSGAFLRNFGLYDATAGELPCSSWEFAVGPTANNPTNGYAIWGVMCNSLHIHATEGGPLLADAEWFGSHGIGTGGFFWDEPARKPYVWGNGTWSLGGDLSAFDIYIEHNLIERWPMRSALPDSGIQYFDPKIMTAGMQHTRVDIRTLSDYGMDEPVSDEVELECQFVAPGASLTISLWGGTYRGMEASIPADGLVEYTVPLVFKGIDIVAVE